MSNQIQDLVEELTQVNGVRGATVTTNDGIMVASSLQGRYSDDVVVGLASFLISTTHRAMDSARGDVRRITLHATHGKLVLEEIGDAYLIVITDQFARMDSLKAEISDVCRRLRRVARLQT
jgi:predicted regulator of Ras-like GTPase activity (Roadblock/LC7/MglB family)